MIEPRPASARVEPLALVALFGVALLVRLIFGAFVAYPSLDDPAFYYTVAGNLARGRGLVVDAIWSYLVPFARVTHPSNEYWQPLPSLVVGAVFFFTGPSFKVAQAVGACVGALLAPITWLVARDALGLRPGWRSQAVIAALLVAVNPLLVYQSVSVDSSTYFAVAGAACLFVAGRADNRPRALWLSGALGGLSYLARSEGLLLVGLAAWAAWTASPKGERLWRAARVVAAAAAFVLPWWARNLAAFGSPSPVPMLALAVLPDYPTLFHYGSPTDWSGFARIDPVRQASLRIAGLARNFGVLAETALVPWAIFLPLGVPIAAAIRSVRLGLYATAILFLTSALLFPVLTEWGAFYHGVGAVVPLLTVLGFAGVRRCGNYLGVRFSNRSGLIAIVVPTMAALVVLVQLFTFVAVTSKVHRDLAQEFGEISTWLDEHHATVVMSNQPYSLNQATGLPAVQLPASDSPEVVKAVAGRYRVQYLVGFGAFGRYPDALKGTPGFVELRTTDSYWIYAVAE